VKIGEKKTFLTMKKKDRSPDKPQSSPNPRPKRRNKKQREPMGKQKKKDSPVETPLQTPVQTPDRPIGGNSFAALQNDSDAEEEKSIATITSEDPQIEIESDRSEASRPAVLDSEPRSPTVTSTPDDAKQRLTSTGPIGQILPTNAERLRESVPIYASQLRNTIGELFPAPKRNNFGSPD
jgi:hypothetical protein